VLECNDTSAITNNRIFIGINSMLWLYIFSEKNVPMSVKTKLLENKLTN
jgi:hypothetical protein